MSATQRIALRIYSALYERALQPRLFQQSAQQAHDRLLTLLARADASPLAITLAEQVRGLAFRPQSVHVGGVHLPHPFIVAAGMVKGHGFVDEQAALRMVREGYNIIPGWRSLPALVGPVEFGSFTRHPRLGNPGTVIWRDAATHSTQNRVGLKNPGAVAAAEFLCRKNGQHQLPPIYGINIALSPGVEDQAQAAQDVHEAVCAFLRRGVVPNWFTLNVSCPNTEDDPEGNQTDAQTRNLVAAALDAIAEQRFEVPLWVKVGPGLAEAQYHILLRAFAELGVKAVIATNTQAAPTPDDTSITAGVGGGRLHMHALAAASVLKSEITKQSYALDVVGCGGVQDAASYKRYQTIGVGAVQYWSALVYRGPLAAAMIQAEGS